MSYSSISYSDFVQSERYTPLCRKIKVMERAVTPFISCISTCTSAHPRLHYMYSGSSVAVCVRSNGVMEVVIWKIVTILMLIQ